MEEILKYFTDLSEEQRRQFSMLDELYHDWNSKINVISRKDIDNLYEHHVLHSLAIAKLIHLSLRRGFSTLAQEAVFQAFHSPSCSLSAVSN